MSKRKSLDKTQARERRNRLLESAAAAELSITEGVREMRAIAGMTQEEFAQHRGVSARVIKAIELGQGNPTVTTLNRIGQFFGLEVAFVPVRRVAAEHTDQESASAPELFSIETIMAGKKALDDYFDKLAAYVAEHGPIMGPANVPPQPSTPAKASSSKKNRGL